MVGKRGHGNATLRCGVFNLCCIVTGFIVGVNIALDHLPVFFHLFGSGVPHGMDGFGIRSRVVGVFLTMIGGDGKRARQVVHHQLDVVEQHLRLLRREQLGDDGARHAVERDLDGLLIFQHGKLKGVKDLGGEIIEPELATWDLHHAMLSFEGGNVIAALG